MKISHDSEIDYLSIDFSDEIEAKSEYKDGIIARYNKKGNIIGIEAPLWSETVSNRQEAEYLIFPRLLGYAEIGWTPVEMRNWDDYKVRLANHSERMKAMNINFFPSKLVPWDAKDKN